MAKALPVLVSVLMDFFILLIAIWAASLSHSRGMTTIEDLNLSNESLYGKP